MRIFYIFACVFLSGCSAEQVAQQMAYEEHADDSACRAVRMDYDVCRSRLAASRSISASSLQQAGAILQNQTVYVDTGVLQPQIINPVIPANRR